MQVLVARAFLVTLVYKPASQDSVKLAVYIFCLVKAGMCCSDSIGHVSRSRRDSCLLLNVTACAGGWRRGARPIEQPHNVHPAASLCDAKRCRVHFWSFRTQAKILSQNILDT